MTTFVALLRAVNVGRTNRITMADLRAAFVEAGHADAVTHIQTGNVIFTASNDAATVKRDVEQLITDRLGLTITAIMRTDSQLRSVTQSNPFIAGRHPDDSSRLYVGFMDAHPAAAAVDAFTMSLIGADEVRVVGTEVYIRYAVGAGTTKLTAGVWNKLGVAITARNWNVTTDLARLATNH